MGIAFGLAPHTFFKYCYDDKKKRFILKLEFVDSDSNATNEELLTVDQKISAPHHINGNEGITAELRKQQHITFDYIVKHTDYFLTPRTPTEIRKDLESIYNLQMHPSNIYNYLKKYTNNELIKTKVLESRLEKLIDEKKIEYRGIIKNVDYWSVSERH